MTKFIGKNAPKHRKSKSEKRMKKEPSVSDVCQVEGCLVGAVAGATCIKVKFRNPLISETTCKFDAEALMLGTLGTLDSATRGRSRR